MGGAHATFNRAATKARGEGFGGSFGCRPEAAGIASLDLAP
jgi:hypothetical protein